MIFCIDPGISARNAAGVALFNSEISRLVAADIVRRDPKLDGIDAQLDIAVRATKWADTHCPAEAWVQTVIAEWPQIYPGEHNKDPNTSLLPLAGIVAAVMAWSPLANKRITYKPREWKGTLNGDKFASRILAKLDERERAIIDAIQPAGLRHNAIDAAGLGLKFLNRLQRTRVVHVE